LVQGFGALLGLQPDGSGQLRVSVASDNTLRVLGHDPEALFSLQSFVDVLENSSKADFIRRVTSLLNVSPDQIVAPVDVFQCSFIALGQHARLFWCTAHKPRKQEDLIVCEFEPMNSILDLGPSKLVYSRPTKILNYKASAEEWERSTLRTSKPLYSLQNSSDDTSSATSVDFIGAMHEMQSQLISSTSMQSLFGVTVGTVSELTGFDRVMVYRFDECKCGAVVAEYLNPNASEDLLIGLHFPSSDLPQWVRDLYQADRVQILRSRTSEAASLRYHHSTSIQSLNMTRSCLREITPDKVQLYSDLDVTSAMNISLVVDGDLWGLITCHAYGSKEVEISPPIREVCRSIGDCVSSQIEREHFSVDWKLELTAVRSYIC
jgi:light-regulated signal transduction histidine kinase (bacteriophytochrome)